MTGASQSVWQAHGRIALNRMMRFWRIVALHRMIPLVHILRTLCLCGTAPRLFPGFLNLRFHPNSPSVDRTFG